MLVPAERSISIGPAGLKATTARSSQSRAIPATAEPDEVVRLTVSAADGADRALLPTPLCPLQSRAKPPHSAPVVWVRAIDTVTVPSAVTVACDELAQHWLPAARPSCGSVHADVEPPVVVTVAALTLEPTVPLSPP